jgi:hypothetical protein
MLLNFIIVLIFGDEKRFEAPSYVIFPSLLLRPPL